MTSAGDVRLDGVRFAHGATQFAFDLSVEGGSATAITGPSGSGKTTLLNLIAGFEMPQSGRITVGGRDIANLPPWLRPVSMVFQENNLFAHLDALSNVGLGIDPGLKLDTAGRGAALGALERVGLAGKETRLPAQLSGGERQRVALARVLVRRNPVLLLDEPFAALGPALRTDMIDLIARLQRETAMTVLLVTHQPEDALKLGGNLAFIDNGRIAVFGGAAEMLDPEKMPEIVRNYIHG